ncbi:hypothetical protein KW801_00710 [Candidatus Saccharibacteria bacterium]|nr:hypothetical protein [Candidatus Saccharibacteria bacterium]
MKSFKQITLLVLTLALMAAPFLLYFKVQALVDWWQLRGYTPPASIVTLANQDAMTSSAHHIFYVNHPDLETDANQFRTDCHETEKTIVLGCYHGNQDGIFIYNVQDARLSGVQQVTAAHEMLHAAYDRLSTKDRKYVDGLLQNYFDTQLHDQRIIDTMNSYRESEPNDVVNEMHSVFGTEIANLPAPLEQYYKRYFDNRQAVTAFAANYQSEFTSRSDQIKVDDAQLAQQKAQINAEELSLQSQLNQINSDRDRLDSLRSSGQIAEYNAGVAGFNSEIAAYNNGVEKLRSDIAAYNQLVSERNSIANELSSLTKALDTRLTPQTVQ